jgi:phage baseplate assembly protein W
MESIRYYKNVGPNGDFEKLTNIDAVVDSILNLLSIPKGSYILNPEIGTEIYKYVFDFDDQVTLAQIDTEIRNTLEQEDRITVLDVQMSPSSVDPKAVQINIVFSYNNSNQPVSISLVKLNSTISLI